MTEGETAARQIVEEFTAAVWRASALGRGTLLEIVSRFYEEQAVIRYTLSIAAVPKESVESSPVPLDEEIEQLQRERIGAALRKTGGNVKRAGEILGIKRNTLTSRIRRMNPAETASSAAT